jgi:hypothetical protein
MKARSQKAGTQSDCALERDTHTPRYPVFMIAGRICAFLCPVRGTRWYFLPHSPEILPRSNVMRRVALKRLSALQRRLVEMRP